jgi:xanthine dehydrogenase FAD-binding subunit
MAYTGIIPEFDYLAPSSLSQALELLRTRGPGGKVLSGGTDLVVQMKNGAARPTWMMDIKGIAELQQLSFDEHSGLTIGAAVPLDRILAAASVPDGYRMLKQACEVIGSVQVKNRASLGGNICNASPSADGAPPLLCLQANAKIASPAGTRQVSLDTFFRGPGQTILGEDELLVAISLPPPVSDSAGSYLRHTTREEMDIAVVGAGAWLALSGPGGEVTAARIALGAVAPKPIRIPAAENLLIGKVPTHDRIARAADVAAQQASPITDVRATAGYRRQLIRVLTRRTLENVCNELGVTG